MLEGLLGQSAELEPIREFVTSKTEGNPFFIEEMVQALFDEGALVRNGVIRQAKPLNAIKLPASVQGVLAARIDRLAPEEKELLQTLSVIGKEFSIRVIERATRRTEDDLRAPLERLQASEFIYEQPAIADTEYTFQHALTLEVAYNSILTKRRKELHEQVARGIEALHEPALDEHFGELAHHYGRSNNIAKAARYARLAGQRAYFRSDLEEAVRRLRTAQELLSKLPQTGERDRQEIPVQLLIGICSTFLEGAGSDQSLAAYKRALELSERTGDAASTFRALLGVQSAVGFSKGVTAALEYGRRLLDLAEKTNDPPMLAEAHCWNGINASSAGDLIGARASHERALELREKLPVGARFYYIDPQWMSEGALAEVLWLLGFPGQALEFSERSLASAERGMPERSPVFHGRLLGIAAYHRRIGNVARVRELTERVMSISRRYGLSIDQGAVPLHGWAIACQGETDKGIAELKQSGRLGRRVGYSAMYAQFDLAELLGKIGRTDEALKTLDALLATPTPQWLHVDLYRLKGDLLGVHDPAVAAEAEQLFRKAIEKSRAMQAKMLELRAVTSLARLLAKHGKRDEARKMLAEIYGWFTEGFDTADLKDAKALLDELGA
jgi:tetratricopeptide (TPR) repeat protein